LVASRGELLGEGRLRLILLATVVTIVVYAGFRTFQFLTDDAYIAFRYISNHQLGLGFVWNPPPFLPVEGYTSWLWVVLLSAVWSITGVEPPAAANAVSLAFGYATLLLVYRMLARMPLPPRLERQRPVLVGLVLLGTATNRTFLTWLSSGLETALFNFCITLWISVALSPRRGRGWVFALCLAATLTALTRADGYLMWAGSVALLGLDALERGSLRARIGEWLCAFPLLGVPLHLLWRRHTYGEWLPNTYYAKHMGSWPESGWRYAASFALEYAWWIWLTLALVWLVRGPRASRSTWIVLGAVLAHFAYYTLAIGGDHFEYRVYSYLVPLLLVSTVWLAARLDLRPAAALSLLAVSIAASWPVPWLHHLETRKLSGIEELVLNPRPMAHRFWEPVRFYARAFDSLQAWLIDHSVCERHHAHKGFIEHYAPLIPSRENGATLGWETRPVYAVGSVGIVSWRFPHLAVIDVLGLNDYVTARHPRQRYPDRHMAHDREPPPGYVECFRPNVIGDLSKIRIYERRRPLTDEQILGCERRFRNALRGGR
jgi:arabinofuranosyltransferase